MAVALGCVGIVAALIGACSDDPPSAAACGKLYDGLVKCTGGTGSAEFARLRTRYIDNCSAQSSLPGSGWNDAAIQACADAVASASYDCGNLPDVCHVAGTLAGGASCVAAVQCASKTCVIGGSSVVTTADGGRTIRNPSCGTCESGIVCSPACGNGMQCVTGSDGVSTTCVQVATVDDGQSCDGRARVCKTGSECIGVCVALLPAGSACGTSGSNFGTPAAICADNLACVNGQCVTRKYASAGEPCGPGISCVVGTCHNGVCPAVIADGDACDSTDTTKTCDEFSRCTDGKCTPITANSCQ